MKKIENEKEGLILINKPVGITSHDVVDIVRKKLGIRRVGHTGTLDPLAEGLLIILVGRYTKLFPKFSNFDKEYLGTLKLGEVTTTGDAQGKVIKQTFHFFFNEQEIENVFNSFRGKIKQVPPMVSAIRVGGERLYRLARKGIVVEREPREIEIHKLEILNITLPYVKFYVCCSKGTYIRKLAEDIGEKLGCGAHIVKIKRIGIGNFKLKDAIEIDEIEEKYLRKMWM